MDRRFLRTKILEIKARKTHLCVFLGAFIVMVTNALVSHGQTANVPVTGFNVDVVADGTAGATPAASTTSAVDGNTVGTGYVFVSPTFGFGSSVCIPGASALPANNQITSTNTTTNTGITYILQSYGAGSVTNNNSLELPIATSGTLTLTTPISASTLYAVCLGGNGAATFTATVHYSDGSSETITPTGGSAPDWCGGLPLYKLTSQQYYRISATATSCTGAGCQYIYEIPIPISPINYSKVINSVTFNNTVTSGSVFFHVMAMGMKAPCAAPPAPTALSLNASTTSGISGSFTASTATGYLVVRYPAGSTPTTPVPGTTYVAGTSLGTGTIVSMGTTTSISASALSANTSYDIYVYGYNTGTTCGGPVFSTTALTGNQTTAACGTPTLGTVTAGVRTITVGPGANAATITAALADINTNGMNSPVILELQSNYVSTGETFPITFPTSPCTGSINTLTLRPAAGANGLAIAGVNAGPTIDLNGATYITIDGRPGGVGSSIAVTANGSLNATNLNIINASATGAAIKLDNGAGNNIIKYCDLQGQNTNATNQPTSIAGVVYIENTGANGNDNNTITYCNIHSDSAAVFPTMGIYSIGTNVTTGYAITSNDNNVVTNNNIYDYFSAASGANSVGIELNYGNNGWNISNNNFFQTASRALNGTFNRAIWAVPYRTSGNVGNGFTISNNYIGGSSPQCGGTAYTLTGSGYFDGIRLEPADAATPSASVIQNNTIQNISITSSSTTDLLHGVAIAGGVASVKILGNTIGSTTTNGSITLSGSASTPVAGHCIILTGTGGSDSIQNNTVAGITIPATSNIFTGLYNAAAGIAYINNNTFGSLTNPQSINLSNTATSTSTSRYVNGIRIVPTSASTCTITNNTIAGIYSGQVYTGSSSQIVGIYIISSTTNISGGVTGNVVRNIYSAARSTGTTTSSAMIGILSSATNASISNVSGNTIDSLICDAASGNVNVMGLYASGSTSVTNTFNNNFIHSIVVPSDANATINGIYIGGGTSTFANNMIRLGINPDGTDYTTTATIYGINANTTTATNIYYNSIYIGGAGLGTTATNTFAFKRTGTSGTYNILNNIFVNNRSNATTGGIHYAINFATSNTGATVNNNLYYANGTGGKFANTGTADVATFTPYWIASDGLSVSGNPQFLAPTGSASTVNLHLNTTVASLAESHAAAVTGITTDIDGDSRSGYSGVGVTGSAPDIGADEYTGVYINLNCTGAPTAGTTTSTNATICPSLAFTLGLTPVITALGISYQWQSSPTGTNTWTNLGTAQTAPSYTTSLTASTDYRCVVTCTASNLSDTSVLTTVTLSPINQCYCTPTVSSVDAQSFTTTGGITNVSVAQTTASGYVNYTVDTVSGLAGVTTISFSGTNPGSDGVAIWVDWNQNGAFESSERMYNTTTYTTSPSGSFTVPAINGTTVLGGVTRMRVLNDYNSTNPSNPCSLASGTHGQVQDFSFNVMPLTACSGAPSPGNTNASITSICVSGTSNLSVTNNYVTTSGIKYQWQSSPDGSIWTNITGDTTYNATTPVLTQTANFRLRMVCTAGPDTSYSVPAAVVVHALPTIVVNPTQSAFCTSGSATIVASGASTYTWSPSTNLDVTTGNTVNATPTAITAYIVTGTDVYNCSNTATATVGPISAFKPVGTATGSCAPNVPVTITATPIATAVGSMEYKLTDTLGTVIGDWQAGTTFTVTPTISGAYKYYLFARNTTCASSISDTGRVLFFDGFGATVTAYNASCVNGDGSLIISGVQGPGAGNPNAVWYSNDFSSSTLNPIYAALQGSASITGNYLQLTANTTSLNGGILIKNPNAIPRIDSVTFNLSVPQTGGADGLSWSYGDISYPSVSGYSFEAGIGNKLIISFDAYGTGNPGIQGIYLTYGQQNADPAVGTNQVYSTVTPTMLAYSSYASWTGATNTAVTIYISSDNKVTLKMGSTVVFNAVQLPAAYASADKSAWQQIIAARTGGISEQHYIDNLGIYYNTTAYSYGSSPANSGTMPTAWQTSNTFSGLNGGDSLDLWVANPSSPATCNKLLGTYGVTAPVVTSLLGTGDPDCVSAVDGFVLLKVPISGTYSVSYNKNGGGTITQTGLVSGNDGANEYVFPALDQGTYTNFKVINASSCVSNTLTAPVTLTAPAATTIAMASASSDPTSQPGAGTQYYTDASCDLLAAVTSANNLGTVTTNLTVGSTIPASTSGEPFLGRYVDITPSQNSTLGATLKLYFTPADFTAYNASPSVGGSNYPAILSDGSNLKIRAFHGTPASGTTGPGGTYDAANADILQPISTVFNVANNYWEVTVFSPNGFSGFFANTTTGTPLSITIGDITAKNEGKTNLVSWNTKTELPGDRFTLERSNDGRLFNTIVEMDAKGKAPSSYTYTDEQPFNGVNYYRLILLNVDGSKDVSKVVSAVVKNGASFQLAAYPNPATSTLTVNVSEVIGKGTIEIVDVTGRTLISKNIDNATSMDISLNGLTDGMYIVKYHDDVHEGTIKLNKN